MVRRKNSNLAVAVAACGFKPATNHRNFAPVAPAFAHAYAAATAANWQAWTAAYAASGHLSKFGS